MRQTVPIDGSSSSSPLFYSSHTMLVHSASTFGRSLGRIVYAIRRACLYVCMVRTATPLHDAPPLTLRPARRPLSGWRIY